MSFLSRIQYGIRNLFHKQQAENQLDDELRAYVDLLTDEKTVSGMPPAEARRAALIEAGGIEQVKQSVRDQRAGAGLELLWQDARYGLRQLRHNLAFTATAIITLGLGIGATTAIFSAVYSLLLRPLPYYDANQLVYIESVFPDSHSDMMISPEFVATQSGTKSFVQLAGYQSFSSNLTGIGDAMRVQRTFVTANFFPMLGVVPQLGRIFSPEEDRSGGPAVILLSDHLWRSKFHADPKVIGKAVYLNGKLETIVGVLPRHFSFPDFSIEPDIYAPIDLDRDTTLAVEKPVKAINPIARLRPGVTTQQAQAEVQAFFLARAKGYPAAFAPWAKNRKMVVEPLQRHLTGSDRKPLYILMAFVAAVLLIACANVANLQLARAVSRRHETSLRGALGASRLRLIRQFLTESLILATFATLAGLAIAVIVTSLIRYAGTLVTLQEAQSLPFGKLGTAIQIDGWVLAFTAGLALLTTLLFGLAPAISGTRTDLRNALQTAALRITSGREQRLLRYGLLVFEISIAVVLLVSAGLLVRSFVNVLRYDSGFDPSDTLTGVTLLHNEHYDLLSNRVRSFVSQLMPRLEALPGVKSAAMASSIPLGTALPGNAIAFEGVSLPPIGTWPTTPAISVTPDYFRTVGTPILHGRAFNAEDSKNSIPVAIVNRSFARQFFQGHALGKRFRSNAGGSSAYQFKTVTIVGIAEDVRHNGIEQEPKPEIFFPMEQLPNGILNILLRTTIEPASLATAMRKAVTAVDPDQPVFDIQTMNERISATVSRRRLIMLLIACFAGLAVILSAVGVYGIFIYSVTQRRQEMGIRLTLGASRLGLLRLIVTQAAWLIAIGGTLGIGAALLLSRLLASMLVGVTPHDPASFSLAWLTMTVVALLASAIPAANAARTDLLSILRTE